MPKTNHFFFIKGGLWSLSHNTSVVEGRLSDSAEESPDKDHIKVVVVGGESVGKTSLIQKIISYEPHDTGEGCSNVVVKLEHQESQLLFSEKLSQVTTSVNILKAS